MKSIEERVFDRISKGFDDRDDHQEAPTKSQVKKPQQPKQTKIKKRLPTKDEQLVNDIADVLGIYRNKTKSMK